MPILETHALRKEYGDLVAVNDVDLSVEPGHVVGLIGPNGAGKTTLLRMLATVLQPTGGTAKILGRDLADDFLSIRRAIGFMPDFFNLYGDLTLRECLQFFAAAYDVERAKIPAKVNEVLEYVDLLDKADAFIRNLSRGMVQRLGLAAKLVHSPAVFLLDEPASGLDPKARIQMREVMTKLSKDGKTVIISSHILTELSGFCSHIALMDRGKMTLYGEVSEIEKMANHGRTLEIRLLNRLDDAVAIVERMPSASIISSSDNVLNVSVAATDEELAQLNSDLVGKGIKVASFAEKKADLEDLFMKLAGKDAEING
jgi:ABC-2 type transport system ATP-binding protein